MLWPFIFMLCAEYPQMAGHDLSANINWHQWVAAQPAQTVLCLHSALQCPPPVSPVWKSLNLLFPKEPHCTATQPGRRYLLGSSYFRPTLCIMDHTLLFAAACEVNILFLLAMAAFYQSQRPETDSFKSIFQCTSFIDKHRFDTLSSGRERGNCVRLWAWFRSIFYFITNPLGIR